MTLALSLVLCGNIGLLIYGIEDSTYVVGRMSSRQQARRQLDPNYRRRKATALICVVWALPTLFGLLAMTDWNCHSVCTCTLSYKSGAPLCREAKCSRLYTPMSKLYLLVVVILWGLECLGLLALLCSSIRTVRHSDSAGACLSRVSEHTVIVRWKVLCWFISTPQLQFFFTSTDVQIFF